MPVESIATMARRLGVHSGDLERQVAALRRQYGWSEGDTLHLIQTWEAHARDGNGIAAVYNGLTDPRDIAHALCMYSRARVWLELIVIADQKEES